MESEATRGPSAARNDPLLARLVETGVHQALIAAGYGILLARMLCLVLARQHAEEWRRLRQVRAPPLLSVKHHVLRFGRRKFAPLQPLSKECVMRTG